MSDYRTLLSEYLRITILRLLSEQPDYSHNESLLLDLVEGYGFKPSRDRMRTELDWLIEQGLITVLKPKEHLWVAKLTERGLDVAKCRITVPGVQQPSPGEF